MSRWTVSDGTEVEQVGTTLAVRGTSAFARAARKDALEIAHGFAQSVRVGPEPGGSVTMDLANVWLVDRWVRVRASDAGLTVTSDYEAKDDDAPPKAKRQLARRAYPRAAGRIY